MKIRKIKLLCAKLACCLTLAFAAADAHAATVEIKIQNFAFNPSTATINVGDTVTWTQLDAGMQHTATSGVDAAPDGKFDSGFLSQNQTYSHTFTEAGNYPYFCIPHSSFMTGTIIVQQATAQAPVVSITSPTNNTVLTAPDQVTISADATVEGSTITMVEFFDGGTFLDMAHQSPFSVTVNLATGTHTLTAKATAANNQTTTSAAVTVTVSSGGTKIDDPLPSIAKSDLTVDLQLILDGMVSPVGMAVPDDGSGRMFVIDQAGLVYVLQNGAKLETPLLDVQSRLVALRAGYDERGLLGMAVHPNFAEHPFIYTYTSEPTAGDADFPITPDVGATNNHQSVITEWKIDSANTNRIDLSSRREILRIDEPQSNHNAGTMHFGPDGFLYMTLGDGGNADDEGSGHLPGQGNAQNINRILGKMIRIDVDGRTSPNGQYGIPNDNPFVGVDGLDEIFAYGFRNPYTWSFDRMTGEIYVADVGQNFVEELDRVFKGGNYGWHIKEGSFYFDPNGTNAGFVTTVPVTEVPVNLI
ncbi:MAG: PQQ-dependent sugar dehydrogenase, partial [Verrucomicrobiota bacterium]